MYYILFNSVTMATRMKNHFRFSGNRVTVTRTPAEISKGGCSYSLVADKSLLKEVIEVAGNYKIAIKGIYKRTADGFFEVSIYDLP